jgi:hypothetical protein
MNQFILSRTSKIVLGGAVAVILAALIFFNFENLAAWATLNNPFQGRWAVVQLSDGEILYGHLAGVNGETIGLKNVYLLDKFMPTSAPTPDITSSSNDFSMGGAPASQPQPKYVPVSDTELLFVNRAAVLYFKFLSPNDPALPYLH